MEQNRRIVLASASPRRRELLEQIGIPFTVQVSETDENVTVSEPACVVEQLSARKAEAVFCRLSEAEGECGDVLVIGADTVVAIDGRILGKPHGRQEALEMLELLEGRTHEVYTGVTFVWREDGRDCRKTFHERTEVTFYPMSREETEEYVATGDCMDKAGAYGIQGFCARYIKGIRGDYNNVVGLPAGRVYQELKGLERNGK